jgi:hypothetical protein
VSIEAIDLSAATKVKLDTYSKKIDKNIGLGYTVSWMD